MVINRNKVIFIFLVCVLGLSICSCNRISEDVWIYQDIKECYAIETLQPESIIYSSPSKDKYIKGFAYDEFYGCEVNTPDLSFCFFAYEFFDNSTAQKYFSEVTEKESNLDTNFFDLAGLHNYRRIVLDQKNVYVVYSDRSCATSATNFLNSIFSKEICSWEQKTERGQGSGSVVS